MSVLNLRVSRDKRKSLCKSSSGIEVKIESIIQKQRKVQNYELVEILKELVIAGTVKEQLKILKDLKETYIKNEEVNVNSELSSYVIYILVDLYLSSKIKCPLREGVSRILRNLTDKPKERFYQEMRDALTVRLKEDDRSLYKYNFYANVMISCFESFSFDNLVTIAVENDILLFIDDALTLCNEMLRTENSLEQLTVTKISKCVHSVTQLCVSIIKKLRTPYHDMFKLHSFNLAKNELIPLDTRCICGFLMVLSCNKQDYQELMEEIHSVPSDLTKISLYSGILNTLPYWELVKEKDIPKLCNMYQVLFNSLLEIQARNPTCKVIIVGVSRIMLLLIKSIQHNPESVVPLLPKLLDYIWANSNQHLDSVKHTNILIMELLKKLHDKEVDILKPIYHKMLVTPFWRSAKYLALRSLVQMGMQVGEILSSCPDLIVNILEEIKSCKESPTSQIVSSYQELMKKHYFEEKDEKKWTNIWIKPLLEAFHHCNNVSLKLILVTAINLKPSIVEDIINSEHSSISTILTCLNLCHENNFFQCNTTTDNNKWKGVILYEILSEAATHQSVSVRLSLLTLIVNSDKMTKEYTTKELELIEKYFKHIFNISSDRVEQNFFTQLKKFLTRMWHSKCSLYKHVDNMKDFTKTTAMNHITEVENEYKTFSKWLGQLCLDNLFPGANHLRKSLALQILVLCHDLNFWPMNEIIDLNEENGNIILSCLSDSYEFIKDLAMKLITTTPGLCPAFQDPDQVFYILKECINAGSSIRPSDSNTATYLLSTLASFQFSNFTITLIAEEYKECEKILQEAVPYQEKFCCLMVVLYHLRKQLNVAESSLLKAAATGPLYGLLSMARSLLRITDFKCLNNIHWHDLIQQIIAVSFSCNNAVASIVNSSSPEGHLPMDLDLDQSIFQDEVVDLDDPKEVSSQMVLLCSWRTVKEVSLLLGEIVEKASISDEEKGGLLNKEDILKIGDHLITLLAETKHRGAFEQAYIGFCKLVSRLWRSSHQDLHQIPKKWLQETMLEIQSEGTLCATRRSAGIPFMIQALMCMELTEVKRSTMDECMDQLLKIAEDQNLSFETHTHALNIMRALFRNSVLHTVISPFVERAIVIAIIGFSASTWAERNSATLLFSTLIVRVFGVAKSKSHILSWKNKMTGRIFFQRYPNLFGFFRKQLELVTKACEDTSLHPSLYPILLFLGRLYPSSLEGTDSKLQLTDFIPYLQDCAGNKVMKTRTLAASAMVPLISPDKLPQFVDKLISEIIQNDHSTNTKHGILLQVSFLLEYCLELPEETILEMENICEHWIEKLLKIWEMPLCSVIVKTSVNVFDTMTARFSQLVCLDTWNSVLEKLKNILMRQNYCNIAYSLCLKKCAEVFIKINIICKPSEEIICEVLNLLEHKEYEVFHTVLDFLIDLLSGDNKSKFYQSELLNYVKLTSAILENISLVDCLINIMFLRNIHANDLEKLLSVVKIYPLFLREIHTNFGTEVFVDLCGSGDDTRVIDVLDCIGALLNEEILFTEKDIQTINNLLIEYSGSEWGEDNHKTIAQILLKHLKKLSSKDLLLNTRLKAYTSLVQLQYEEANMWQTLIQVLEDNEEDIQCKASVFLVLTLGNLTSCNPFDHVKGQVFDKGEVSIYYEEALLSRLAGKYFKNLLNSTDCKFLKTPLTSNLCEFLHKNCGIKCDSLDNFLCQISEKNVMSDYSKICSFLRPGYQAAKLKSLRIKNIYM